MGYGTNIYQGGGGGSFLAATAASPTIVGVGHAGNGFVSIGSDSLYVGTNSSDQSANFSSGTNDYYNIVIGGSGDTNNSVSVANGGTVVEAANNIVVGQNGSGNTMTASSGASIVAQKFSVIGLNATASNNSAVVTGVGSTWSSGSALLIGDSGSGNSMSVQAGAGVVSGGSGVALGYNVGSSGNSLLVDGSGSTLANSSDLAVGFSGSGNTVVVSNGGTLTTGQASYGGVIGLNASSSNNSVLVTGVGSSWNIEENGPQTLTVGYNGSGNTLEVVDGGRVSANSSYIGRIAGSSNNSVLVAGSGSTLSNAANLYIGDSGSGNSLVISNGGKVTSFIAEIGFSAGSSNNSVLVTGSGSSLSNNSFYGTVIGNGGEGTLTVANGGVAASTAPEGITVASQSGSVGTLNIGGFGTNDAAGTINAPKITFGAGTGTINFNQSNATTISAVISGNGSVNQLGSGTTILAGTNTYSGTTTVNNGTLVVQGQSSLGTSSVTVNGGTLEASGVFTEFPLALNAGNMTLTGAESSWNTGTNTLSVGNSSQGASVVVEGGASVVSEGLLALGMNAGASNNSVLVTGTGSTWSNSSNLTIGDAGEGTLTIANGGSVSANAVIIASQAGSSGTLNFGSLGGSDTAGNFLPPAISFGSGSGTINFNQTDTVAATGFSGNGSLNQLGSGTTILTGTNTYSGTTTVNRGTLVVQGQSSLGTSSVTVNGGTLEASGVFTEFPLALNAGNMTLTGAGSSWNTGTNPLSVGNSSQGASVVVEGGASVVSEGLLALGMNAGASNNSVLVTGSNSSWSTAVGNNTWTVLVGDYGSGNTLEVVDGGQVSAPWFYIGNLVGSSNNSVLVTGSGSTLSNSENLYIGLSGSGNSLVISNGGKVTSFSAWLGLNAGSSNNSVLVTGSGSSLSNNSIAGTSIGNAGEGTLTVANGGVAASTVGGIWVALDSGSVGTLNIGGFGTNDAAGTINAPKITFGAGTGTINFNQSNATTISAVISGNGSVNQLGSGTTTLSGNNTYTGTTTVVNGTLLVDGEISLSDVSVLSGAAIGGSGTLGGSLSLAAGAQFVFSLSGALTVDGTSVTFGGLSINDLVGLDSTVPNGAYTLIDGTAPINFSNVANLGVGEAHDIGGGKQAYFSEGSLVVNVVPEPSTYALLGISAVALGAYVLRRRRSA